LNFRQKIPFEDILTAQKPSFNAFLYNNIHVLFVAQNIHTTVVCIDPVFLSSYAGGGWR